MSERPWNVLYSGNTFAGRTTSFAHVRSLACAGPAPNAWLSRPIEPTAMEWAHREPVCRLRVLQEWYSNLYVPRLRDAQYEHVATVDRSFPERRGAYDGTAHWNRMVPYWRALARFLTQVDGVVFVADSQVERFEANAWWIELLELNLRDAERDPARIPLVFQLNKRDLPNAADVATLRAALQWPGGAEYVESVATRGVGTAEALDALVARLHGRLGREKGE